MRSEAEFNTIAIDQGGVIRRSQALACGLPESLIDSRVRSGRWRVIANGVYRVLPMESKRDLVRAAASILPHATVSHFSAAKAHGMERVPTSTVSVTVHSSTTHRFPGVRVFRTRDLAEHHSLLLDGLHTTTVARTVVDLAGHLSPRHLDGVVDDSVAAGLTRWRDLSAVLEEVARRGKPGISNLRRVLETRLGADFDGSRLEMAGARLLKNAGLDGFLSEYAIPWEPARRFDVAYPHHRVAIEWDSRRWHTQAAAIQADRERDRGAALNGWRLVRFTWADVHDRPQIVSETVRALLAAR